MTSLLEIRNLVRVFDGAPALDDVSMTIESGEFFTLLGPSGCGKTTLLRMIGGFDQPSRGSISLDGEDLLSLPAERRPVRTVFQNYALFPHMTVGQNIGFPLRMAGVEKSLIQPKVEQALAGVRLEGFMPRYPSELSGGQRQRVSIARALITEPRILLLDEPLAALDAKLREQMQIELISLQRSVGITFIYVTHDQTEALALSSRIAVMSKGKVVQLDTPNRIYAHPTNRFVADFIGSCNLINGCIENIAGSIASVAVPGLSNILVPAASDARVGVRGVIALRPEHILILRDERVSNGYAEYVGVVETVLYQGDVSMLSVRLNEETVITSLIPNLSKDGDDFTAGQRVRVAWAEQSPIFLAD
jgi:spermidine/putrescine transport system ATP-binding protein